MPTDPKWFCTTVLKFKDRIEGQVLHVGTQQECEQMKKMMPAVAILGAERCLESCLIVAPVKDGEEVTSGMLWRNPIEEHVI